MKFGSRWCLYLLIVAIGWAGAGCRARAPSPPASSSGSSGFLVLPDRGYLSRFGFVGGDTIPEVRVSRDAPAVRKLASQPLGTAGCIREFANRTRRIFVSTPACTRDYGKIPFDSESYYIPLVEVVDSAGRPVRDTAGDSLKFFGDLVSAVCPAGRDTLGNPVHWLWLSPDGCSRQAPVGRWRNLQPGPRVGNGVIIADAIGRGMFVVCSRARPGGIDGEWTPSVSDVEALESRLGDYFKSHMHDSLVGPLSDYRMQFGGFTRLGRHFIYVNAAYMPAHGSTYQSTPSNDDYWLRSPVIACDGGTSFFGIVYDVEAGTFQELEFNGYA
jgi:hypothetical protein